MANEAYNNDFPDIESDVRGLEIAPCHKCGCTGVVRAALRRDKKYSVAIGCQCGTPYSVIYDGSGTVAEIVRLWNRYQHIRELTKGMKH